MVACADAPLPQDAPGAVVMVVEDDVEIRESLLDILSDHGYAALGAANGRDALDKLKRSERLPCIILLDLMMPVMDGTAFREEQRRTPPFDRIPVVIISAYRDLNDRVKGLDAAAHLKKPIGVEDVIGAVRKWCA
jgi:CheY-like chemotaxis protein